jgi:hypothetical protein
MNDIQKRFLLFIFGCIGTRLALVYVAKTFNKNIVMYLGYLTLIPAFMFAYLYLFGLRKTGAEVFGGKIWWNDLRPIHSILYFIFSYMAINKMNNSWKVLLLDVFIGFTAFIYHHYKEGNFKYLF